MRLIDMLYHTRTLKPWFSEPAPKRNYPSPKKDKIIEYIKGHPECTKADIIAELGITDKAAVSWLHALTKEGSIQRMMYPLTRNGRPPSVYWVGAL
jgi:predicted ArsR family transcriptional regulator